jgi:hypothetical protein
MQGTAITSGLTQRLYIQTTIIWQNMLNAEVRFTVMLYGLSQAAFVYLLVVLTVM